MFYDKSNVHFCCQILVGSISKIKIDDRKPPTSDRLSEPAAAAKQAEQVLARRTQKRLARLRPGSALLVRFGGTGTTSPRRKIPSISFGSSCA